MRREEQDKVRQLQAKTWQLQGGEKSQNLGNEEVCEAVLCDVNTPLRVVLVDVGCLLKRTSNFLSAGSRERWSDWSWRQANRLRLTFGYTAEVALESSQLGFGFGFGFLLRGCRSDSSPPLA